ncbi:hypothetical protein [Halocella sp. SP3-1]|uniref:hypothetical protein n=1 Tax=Halocella sp. SP3-1 TaxID=2382161 RepID=UPI000F760E6E|nr:hypothetical protein [Halocella sp. SP3-1]AZO95275.1 hypothetical protein D7D81_12110 [Halocella sp. SP3-1]
MANTIALAKKYLPLLDAKYKMEAKTSILDTPNDMVRGTQQAGTVLIPKIALQGLGDYSRADGYVSGDVTLEWEAHTLTQDRGRSFQVDAMDNEETVGIAFGKVSGEFIRIYVAPEIDAYRFATMADLAALGDNADLTDSDTVEAIDAAMVAMDDAEVPEEGRILFITSTGLKNIKQSDQYVRNVQITAPNGLDRRVSQYDGMSIVKVPQTRFYSAIDLNDGSTSGQEAGGYAKASAGYNINFMIVHPTAVAPVTKTALPRIFDPMTNQSANAWKFDYRLYHDLFVPNNKVDGIYLHTESQA